MTSSPTSRLRPFLRQKARDTLFLLAVLNALAVGGLLGWSCGPSRGTVAPKGRTGRPDVPQERTIGREGRDLGSPAGEVDSGVGEEVGTREREPPVVWVTRSGDTYHRATCRYGKRYSGSRPVSLAEAARSRRPCQLCKAPPRPSRSGRTGAPGR